MPEHLSQGFSSTVWPQLLGVGCLWHGDFLEWIIVLKKICNYFEALISYDTHIKLDNIFVGVDSFDDAHKTSFFKADSTEHKFAKWVIWVVA